jgi:hypothetical protein
MTLFAVVAVILFHHTRRQGRGWSRWFELALAALGCQAALPQPSWLILFAIGLLL